ncbi:PepSY-associated TM helix domain-containing protein [Pseudoalteromonas denitrificans]|uniref:PepSY-associated TM region n=1 Tax=Pseudoalteromonas denitrificans DSM 6059 TaxID=1123010 RepID=A0A1I1NVD3_9GAMM|nr:PepSY-associated TM helix domain-containing protein [Pseudoalteromonas denitrificans]SFC97700.1 hypothetical protein SAMN02745724_03087 [Pseudoalteromonas denitrificans DSM 6059]
MTKSKSIKWFNLNRSLHRDIGYFCIGMTLVFAISGIALNHIHQWNSNYNVTQKKVKVEFLETKIKQSNFEHSLLAELNEQGIIKARFWQDENTLKLFIKNKTLFVLPKQNLIIIEEIKPRFLLRNLNFLHLNEAKKAWTWFSDFYALLLIFLAISSLFMVKGKKSVTGTRGFIILAGFIAPAGFVFYYAS